MTAEQFNDKFHKFSKLALQKQKQLEEVLLLRERQKEDTIFSRQVEQRLRSQLEKSQERCKSLQSNLNSVNNLKDQLNNQKEKLLSHETEINNMKKTVQNLKENLAEKVSTVSRELQLLAEKSDLEKLLKEKDDKFYLTRMENQASCKERESTIKKLHETISDLRNNLVAMERERSSLKNDLQNAHSSYGKRIADYEEIVRQYEKDRQQILGEQESPVEYSDNTNVMKYWDKKVNLTWADAARKARWNTTVSNVYESPKEPSTEANQAPNAKSDAPFKFKFKAPFPASNAPTIKVAPFGSKVKQLQVNLKRGKAQSARKQFFREDDGDLL